MSFSCRLIASARSAFFRAERSSADSSTAIGSAVCPIACCVWTDKLDASFAIISAWGGMIAAVAVWMIIGFSTAPAELAPGYSAIDALGQLNAQLFGSLTQDCTRKGAPAFCYGVGHAGMVDFKDAHKSTSFIFSGA